MLPEIQVHIWPPHTIHEPLYTDYDSPKSCSKRPLKFCTVQEAEVCANQPWALLVCMNTLKCMMRLSAAVS